MENSDSRMAEIIRYFLESFTKNESEEDLLWDFAKNCVSKLQLIDCIVYLIDDSRQVLIQRAAYGAKSNGRVIVNPIEIPVGAGITGTVAKTGIPEIVGDTSLDPRYIIDDTFRYSELAVPIFIDKRLAGVIDAEHNERNFFDDEDKIILLAASHLLGMRLKMIRSNLIGSSFVSNTPSPKSIKDYLNPHFIFNTLNSIQFFIASQNWSDSYDNLSKFSLLLRKLLEYSDDSTNLISNEVEVIRNYIELESLRMDGGINYTVVINPKEIEMYRIPSLRVLPFLENSIYHGLSQKANNRELHVCFEKLGNEIHCDIIDNGIGRRAALEIKLRKDFSKEADSLGAFNFHQGWLDSFLPTKTENLEVIDLYDEQGLSIGTKVRIRFPVQIE